MRIKVENLTDVEIERLLTNHRYELTFKQLIDLQFTLQYEYYNKNLEITGYEDFFNGRPEMVNNVREWNILRKYYLARDTGRKYVVTKRLKKLLERPYRSMWYYQCYDVKDWTKVPSSEIERRRFDSEHLDFNIIKNQLILKGVCKDECFFW